MSVPRGEVTFGSLLRAHRLASGLTQEALAERSGVGARTIQEVEAGHVQPRRSTATSLAEALGLSNPDFDELLATSMLRPRQRRPGPSADGADRRDAPDVPSRTAPTAEVAAHEPVLMALPRPTPTNVPWPVSALLGRETELSAIRRLIEEDCQRLVTLTGVGGSGKTRLAVQVAAESLDAFADGVWFVELASTSSPSLVPQSVAGTLGVQEVQGAPLMDTLLGFLRHKRVLLVLDNCEHLIDACAELADRLLTASPDLSILATSREPLRVSGERRWQVRPLTVPDPSGGAAPEGLAEIASVRLFVERARAIDPDFSLTQENAPAVAQVCARLDGIPLAIELAASRLGVLAVEQVAERLDDAFRLLAGGSRAGPTRQQTMEAALTWSYDLLDGMEQAAFRALSAFAGGFDLEAAEAIVEVRARGSDVANQSVIARPRTPDPRPLTPDTLDVLARLVDKSLIVVGRTPRGRRYRLLEPVRQYARRRLTATGEEEEARARHAAFYAALTEQATPLLGGPEQAAWLDRLDVERDNLRAALIWIAEHDEADTLLRLAAVLVPYWEARGYLSEGRRWLDDAVTASRARPASRAIQMQALLAAGRLAHWQVDLNGAETLLTEALTLARELADRRAEGEVLAWLSAVYREQGAVERGLMLGEESLRLGHELADEAVIALALLNLGIVLRHTHKTARAMTVLDECVLRYRRLGDARYAAIASTMLGWAAMEAGEHDRATRILHESVLELRSIGHHGFVVYALRGLARVADAQHEVGRALRFFGASEGLRTSLGMRHSPSARGRDQILIASLRQQLTAPEYDAIYAAGEAMSLDQVLAEIVVE